MTTHKLPERLEDYEPSGGTYRGTGKHVVFGIDSDGCVNKGMRAKHGGPFPRAAIELYHLEPIAEPWRIAWTYVNEIEDRGCPRFVALALAVTRVAEMPVVKEAVEHNVVTLPAFDHLRRFLEQVAAKKGYGDNVIGSYIATLPDGPEKEELQKVAAWSKKVDGYVETDCPHIAPYQAAIDTIKLASEMGVDNIIVSGTPEGHLRDTWGAHGLADQVRGVFGRDSGKKEHHMIAAMRAAQKKLGKMYDVAILFGDAPGDAKSAAAASKELGTRVAFMPIRVGFEEEDWRAFEETYLRPGALERYDEAAQAERMRAFTKNLERRWDPSADLTKLFA